jgi:hypothetical protein
LRINRNHHGPKPAPAATPNPLHHRGRRRGNGTPTCATDIIAATVDKGSGLAELAPPVTRRVHKPSAVLRDPTDEAEQLLSHPRAGVATTG